MCDLVQNLIVKLDLKVMNIEIIQSGISLEFSGIAMCQNCLYITSHNSDCILRYDLDKKQEYIIENQKSNWNYEGIKFYSHIFTLQDAVVLIPNYGQDIYIIHENSIENYLLLPKTYFDLNDCRRIWNRFTHVEIDADKTKALVFPSRSNMLISIDVCTGEIVGKIYKLNDTWMNTIYYENYIMAYFRECDRDKIISLEFEKIDLSDYIAYLCSTE